jgi:hypothetical protein
MSDGEQSALIAAAVAADGDVAPAVDGGSKDGTPGGQQQYKFG